MSCSLRLVHAGLMTGAGRRGTYLAKVAEHHYPGGWVPSVRTAAFALAHQLCSPDVEQTIGGSLKAVGE